MSSDSRDNNKQGLERRDFIKLGATGVVAGLAGSPPGGVVSAAGAVAAGASTMAGGSATAGSSVAAGSGLVAGVRSVSQRQTSTVKVCDDLDERVEASR